GGEVMPGLLRLFGERVVLRLMKLKMADGVRVVVGEGVLQPLHDRLGDRILDAVDVEVVQVLAGADVTVRRVVIPGHHLFVILRGNQKTHHTSGPRRTGPIAGEQSTSNGVTRLS